jgi:hypothetical protein
MGRPRKYPKVEPTIEVENNKEIQPKIKKKRGRKPKIRTVEELALLSQVGKKKRGRKPKEQFNFNSDNSNNTLFNEEDDSIIVRLNINIDDIKNVEENQKYPTPYDPNNNVHTSNNQLQFSNINQKTNDDNSTDNANDNSTDNANDNDINSDIDSDIDSDINSDFDKGIDKGIEINVNKTSVEIKDESIEDDCIIDINTDIDTTADTADTTVNTTADTIVDTTADTIVDTTADTTADTTVNTNVDTTADTTADTAVDTTSKNKFNSQPKTHSSNMNNDYNIVRNNKYNDKCDNRQISLLLKDKYYKENRIDILLQLVYSNKINKWPEHTNISCLWCCHEFLNTPWGVPYKYEDNVFHLFGIFCSPNCVASHIFELSNLNTKWEYFSLLNLLYYKVYGKLEEITLSPSKLCLKKFGGSLDIADYRIKSNTDNLYILKFPPTISIIPIIEEINKNKHNITNMVKSSTNFIPLDTNRIKKANTDFKLKRTKPLTNKKNTLDSCMNINIIPN